MTKEKPGQGALGVIDGAGYFGWKIASQRLLLGSAWKDRWFPFNLIPKLIIRQFDYAPVVPDLPGLSLTDDAVFFLTKIGNH